MRKTSSRKSVPRSARASSACGRRNRRARRLDHLARAGLCRQPGLRKIGRVLRVHAGGGTGRERFTLKPGLSAQDVEFGNLFYADIAKQSYAAFKALKDAGKIPPAPIPGRSGAGAFGDLAVPGRRAACADRPLYNDALKREIDKIAAAIPHDELAIQFDVASAVFARLERNEASSYGRSKAEMQETFATILVDLGNRVPADIDLLYHLCYGDSNIAT